MFLSFRIFCFCVFGVFFLFFLGRFFFSFFFGVIFSLFRGGCFRFLLCFAADFAERVRPLFEFESVRNGGANAEVILRAGGTSVK